ncbi:helix-turn-helix transcriptional regulator [Sphingobium sp. H39-3-25]|uniref:helix-turn-helix domain-containing protein n=1 Tax=Sphingobium arseniciresistens TaxID=3030834 RepID=UPI0023B98C74|nr:helix-turn-helix transcriptional regulator [Sphingobium arseniciresistens]
MLSASDDHYAIDQHRAFVFPNKIRKFRKDNGFNALLKLSEQLSSTTYIRLSKIERGEVFAKAEELVAIASALDVDPASLLIDIDDPAFSIADWAAEYQKADNFDFEADRFAVLLAAALRLLRATSDDLTIAAIELHYGLAPVILSRIENAFKPFERWSEEIQHALFRLFGVTHEGALRAWIEAAHARGDLAETLPLVANPELRIAKTRTKVAALREELAGAGGDTARATTRGAKITPQPALPAILPPSVAAAGTPVNMPVTDAIHAADHVTLRLVPVFGSPLAAGLIAKTATGTQVEAPRSAGPNAYGLRVCRPTLGAGLPGRATVIVDPDRFPSAGGLAVVREEGGLRLVSITFDRQGRMLGYSEHPACELQIDEMNPADIATVVGAVFE